jgi:hypothetical protein
MWRQQTARRAIYAAGGRAESRPVDDASPLRPPDGYLAGALSAPRILPLGSTT